MTRNLLKKIFQKSDKLQDQKWKNQFNFCSGDQIGIFRGNTSHLLELHFLCESVYPPDKLRAYWEA